MYSHPGAKYPRPVEYTPPLGVCMNYPRMKDKGCEGCGWFEGCTYVKKGSAYFVNVAQQ